MAGGDEKSNVEKSKKFWMKINEKCDVISTWSLVALENVINSLYSNIPFFIIILKNICPIKLFDIVAYRRVFWRNS